MPKTIYDDFSKLALGAMAKKISDITFMYRETKVPAKHYKDQLSTNIQEVMESTTNVRLVEVIFSTLDNLKKESPRLFFQAMVLLDLGIKPNLLSTQQYQALSLTADFYEQNDKSKLLDRDILGWFNDIMENGALYTVLENEDD